MNNKLDPETLKIPAYMRKKMIVSQARQKLILTALDRKQAKLPPNSKVAVAPVKRAPLLQAPLSLTPRKIGSSSAGAQEADLFHASSFESGGPFPQIGEVTHFLDKIGVAIIMLSAPLKIGDKVIIEGEGELFIQDAGEMQIDRKPVKKAKKNSHIGLKVHKTAKINGAVYRLS